MKPKYRLTASGAIVPVLRPFEQDQMKRLLNSLIATPKHIAFVALQEYEGMK